MGTWKNVEARRAYYRERYRTKRGAMIERLGGKCAKCGGTENLEIDHIDSTQKQFDVSAAWALAPDKVEEELLKCQVLCEKCHKAKSDEHGDYAMPPARHGTDHMYTKFKCRCDLCKAARAEARKALRERRAAQGLPPQ